MKGQIDTAFLRRLRFVIDMPLPDAAARTEIWRRAFPPGVPTDGLDSERLARLDITGGSIAVIAVNAAFLAAAVGGPVTMAEVEAAARAEFRKLDKPFPAQWRERTPR
jgi:SpoVK/Ycf46/Vps4 family AAA+-type ATPase